MPGGSGAAGFATRLAVRPSAGTPWVRVLPPAGSAARPGPALSAGLPGLEVPYSPGRWSLARALAAG